MKKLPYKHLAIIIGITMITSINLIVLPSEKVSAAPYPYTPEDFANAILADPSTFISAGSSYTDTDDSGHRQGIVLSSLGKMEPTNGSTFALLSNGIAGTPIITTNAYDPGDERGTWFIGGKYGNPRDQATLTLKLQVPLYMHYLYYDIQFFTAEYPDYVGSRYNDKLTVTVDSPSQGITEYVIDVSSGDFVWNSDDIPGTGFDIYATSGYPGGVDWVTTTPQYPGADAGATALVTREVPVSPGEQITITFDVKDTGDNLFDSGAFIDNVVFSGYAKTEIIARKTVQDLNGEPLECGDVLKYTVTISNIGTADQNNNPANEFDDFIPDNTTYVSGSATATSGTIEYNEIGNNITWNGGIPSKSSVSLSFKVTVNDSLPNGAIISNQGTVYWDSNEDHLTNDATELTDDPAVDDGIDLDEDGETGDDDPTILVVTSYEPPSVVTEGFSDDFPGGKATQSYQGHSWFETSEQSVDSNFEVVSGYQYPDDLNAFKTKLRKSSGPQYWNYTLSNLNSDMDWWEIWFYCGDASESYDLSLDFKDTEGDNIAQIKFEYVNMGTEPPLDWVLTLSYWNKTINDWSRLNSDFPDGYLHNNWYKLRIEKNGSNIDYSLNRSDIGEVDSTTGPPITSFTDFSQVKWSTTKNPVVCPMFFWDKHRVGLTLGS